MKARGLSLMLASVLAMSSVPALPSIQPGLSMTERGRKRKRSLGRVLRNRSRAAAYRGSHGNPAGTKLARMAAEGRLGIRKGFAG